MNKGKLISKALYSFCLLCWWLLLASITSVMHSKEHQQ